MMSPVALKGGPGDLVSEEVAGAPEGGAAGVWVLGVEGLAVCPMLSPGSLKEGSSDDVKGRPTVEGDDDMNEVGPADGDPCLKEATLVPSGRRATG